MYVFYLVRRDIVDMFPTIELFDVWFPLRMFFKWSAGIFSQCFQFVFFFLGFCMFFDSQPLLVLNL